MRKIPLSVGCIILFAGIIIFSSANYAIETPENQLAERVKDLPYGQWKISKQFDRGEKIFVAFAGPKLIDIPNGVPAIATIWINITDPTGGNTTLRADFRVNLVTKNPELNITLESESEGLIVDKSKLGTSNDSPENLGGETQHDGNYTAYVYTYGIAMARYYYPPNADLPRLDLWRIVLKKEYSFGNLLPVGVALIVGGAFLSIWAASTKQSYKSRRKYRQK